MEAPPQSTHLLLTRSRVEIDVHSLCCSWSQQTLSVWGEGSYGRLGLGDTKKRLVQTLLGAEEVFGESKVRTVACGRDHELWAWGRGAQGRLGLNDGQDRLVPMRVDPQHFAHAPISAVAPGESPSTNCLTASTLRSIFSASSYFSWRERE